MRPSRFPAEALSRLLGKRKMATMPELMAALGTEARRTVFRKLGELSYRTSYSHRGRFYTLDEVAEFDEWGLWSCGDVWFSIDGTLLATCARLVETAESGYLVDELDNLLHVSSRDALRKLVGDARLVRERVGGRVLYCASDQKRRAQQLLSRRAALAEPGVAGPLPEPSVMPDELRAAIVLFFSLLDEKLRRLYAGLEALKIGRGGDGRIAALLGLDVGTVARGRQDLLRQDVELERVRRAGAGRSSAEKKRRKSWRASKN
jgi:hypothetical protein